MTTNVDQNATVESVNENQLTEDASLRPLDTKDRTMGPIPYMFMWIGDGVNMGNMTLGASIVVAGVATLNLIQTIAAAIAAILIISTVFILNDRIGYEKGIPYVVQLRMSFGFKGTIISSLMRAVPAIIWYGVQSWIGGSALNEVLKILTNGAFDHMVFCFIVLQVVQIILSLFGFHAIKWVESLASIVIMSALVYVFIILMMNYRTELADGLLNIEGSWGLPFFGFIMIFLGNYAAIFLNASDFSRELKTGFSHKQRGLLYFSPIMLAYGFVLIIGAMVATVTGINNPPSALAAVIDNSYVTLGVSAFIVLATIATNMVANIVAPTYVITMLTKVDYKVAAIITGLLAMGAFPWVLVQEESSAGLDLFILIYSAFLGPMVSILIVEFFILRKQKVNVKALYDNKGQFANYNRAGMLSLFIGAAFAFINVDLAWIIGFVVGGLSYYLLSKYAFIGSSFKKGTIFENKSVE